MMRRCRRQGADRLGPRDDGSAVVEYVLVSTLLLIMIFAVVQIGLLLHARNVLTADAAEGARAAAVRGASLDDGEQACAGLIRTSLSSAVLVAGEPCRGSTIAASDREPALVRMEADATVGLAFVPGGRVHLHAVARAVREPGS